MFQREGQLVRSKRIRHEFLSEGPDSWVRDREAHLLRYTGYVKSTIGRNGEDERIQTENVMMEFVLPDHLWGREHGDETSGTAANFEPEAVTSEPQSNSNPIPYVRVWNRLRRTARKSTIRTLPNHVPLAAADPQPECEVPQTATPSPSVLPLVDPVPVPDIPGPSWHAREREEITGQVVTRKDILM